MRPFWISSFRTGAMRARRAEDMPTDSGAARGRGSAAKAATAASSPAATAKIERMVPPRIDVLLEAAIILAYGAESRRAGAHRRGNAGALRAAGGGFLAHDARSRRQPEHRRVAC